MNKLRVLDHQGQEQDWDWLVTNFGAVRVERAEATATVRRLYRLVTLQEASGPAALLVRVLDEEGRPLKDVRVVRNWADAPELPAWPFPASRWRNQGVLGATDGKGNIAFGLGTSDYYSLPQSGAGSVWVADPAGPSDLVGGLGMLDPARHRHFDLVFQLMPVEEPAAVSRASDEDASQPVAWPAAQSPPPPPSATAPSLTDEQWSELVQRLDLIIETLEEQVKE